MIENHNLTKRDGIGIWDKSEIKINIHAEYTSAEAKLKNIATGSVSVFIVVAPARVTVAPNSPTALAHINRKADTRPFLPRGNIIFLKA